MGIVLCGGSESWKGDSGQALKCARWMPRHGPATKDVASCEKLRGAASKLRSGDVRMGKPGGGDAPPSREGGQPGELKHLSTRRKRNQMRDSLSSGERKGKSPNRVGLSPRGVAGLQHKGPESIAERAWNGGPERVRVPYAKCE